jgi:hypothetical protein
LYESSLGNSALKEKWGGGQIKKINKKKWHGVKIKKINKKKWHGVHEIFV